MIDPNEKVSLNTLLDELGIDTMSTQEDYEKAIKILRDFAKRRSEELITQGKSNRDSK